MDILLYLFGATVNFDSVDGFHDAQDHEVLVSKIVWEPI